MSSLTPTAVAAGLRLPTAHAYVDTHHLKSAMENLGYAKTATPADAERYIARAMEHAHYATENLRSAMSQWGEYNDRLDRLVEFLAEHEAGS